MTRAIYLDNAATTPLLPEVVAAMASYWSEEFANPSSIHGPGTRAARALDEARAFLRGALGADRFVFTGSGTEANNLALLGSLEGRRPGKVLASGVEHSSIRSSLPRAAALGHQVEVLRVDETGRVDLEDLEQRLDPSVRLVAFLHGNNETGTLSPLQEIVALVRAKAPDAHVHADCVQVLGKVEFDLDRSRVDSASVSAHKIHGPKGVGGLALSSKARVSALITGGGQEGGLRSGTENVPGIVGLAKATEVAVSDRAAWTARAARLRDRLERSCLEKIDGVAVNGHPVHRLPHVLSLRFAGVVGEVILHHLEAAGIFVSTGAACHEGKDAENPVLKAMGLSRDEVRGTVRFSFSRLSRDEDVDAALEVLPGIVEKLRRMGA